jgi:hypothetical protein
MAGGAAESENLNEATNEELPRLAVSDGQIPVRVAMNFFGSRFLFGGLEAGEGGGIHIFFANTFRVFVGSTTKIWLH